MPLTPLSAAHSSPDCPKCRSRMVLRDVKKGPRAGSSFYGCSMYPDCNGALPKSVGDAVVAEKIERARIEAAAAEAEAIAELVAEDLGALAAIDFDI